MRIISRSKENHFLLEVHENELANILVASYYTSGDVSELVKSAMKNGSDIGVSKIYKNYEAATRLLGGEGYSQSIVLENLKPLIGDFKTLIEKGDGK